MVSSFSGIKVADLIGFPFYPNRKVILSVGLREASSFEGNFTEADIRDACLAEARKKLLEYKSNPQWFEVRKEGNDARVTGVDGNQSLPMMNFDELADRFATLRMGRSDDGGYVVIVGGVVNQEGELESHGRWLPYPILVPMMVGTAMSLEKEYYTSDTAFEIGRLSQKTLQGDFGVQRKNPAFFWAAHQLARKMNLIQMSELTPKLSQSSEYFRSIRFDTYEKSSTFRSLGQDQVRRKRSRFFAHG